MKPFTYSLGDFEDLDLGPYSETVECVVEELATMGLVSIVKKTTTTFSLTEKGAEFYNKLKLPTEEIEVESIIKNMSFI